MTGVPHSLELRSGKLDALGLGLRYCTASGMFFLAAPHLLPIVCRNYVNTFPFMTHNYPIHQHLSDSSEVRILNHHSTSFFHPIAAFCKNLLRSLSSPFPVSFRHREVIVFEFIEAHGGTFSTTQNDHKEGQ